ncbi:MAG: hypothetical protein RL362_1196 [Bacteroidota bacterium]|jgi:glycosyltransferase involved in cell wall biosynthesis
MSQDLPSIDIVIPCWQEEQYIEKCVLSCLKQDYKGLINVIVADGGSTDATRNILNQLGKEWPSLQVVLHDLKSTPISLNKGIQSGKGDWVMILGAHSELPQDYLSRCIHNIIENPSIDCIGGWIQNHYHDNTAQIIGWAMSSSFGVGNAHFRTGQQKGFVDTVAFGMYRRICFEKVGLFNEELARNQDDEFNYRFTQAGFKIFLDPTIHCSYFVRSSWRKVSSQYFQYGLWKVYVNVLHRQITTIRQMIPALFVAYMVMATILSITIPDWKWLWLSGGIIYLGLGYVAASQKSGRHALSILFAFFILHSSYGCGYWQGIFQFILLGRKPKSQQAAHNR